MYLTYADYVSYGGTLEETTFNSYEFEAEVLVDWYTFNRLQKGIAESGVNRLQRCMYELIGMIKNQKDMINASVADQSETGVSRTVASQSNDGVSVSYNVINSSDLYGLLNTDMENMIKKYLYGVKNSLGRVVLYRGIYPDE